MQTEGAFWRNSVKPQVTGTGRWERIETSTRDAFPDCVVLSKGVTSLVELKSKGALEEGLGTTALQRHFLDSWCKAGGNAYLLARMKDRILFLWGEDVQRTLTEEQWVRRSLVHGHVKGAFDWGALCWYVGQSWQERRPWAGSYSSLLLNP